MKLPSLYFDWLQKDNPTGAVDRFPELHDRFETSVPGLYCAGDLTGVPLIRLAAESGHDLVERLAAEPRFRAEREANREDSIYDLIIVGAGPAGVAACLGALRHGMRCLVLESSRRFNTIANFPAGKAVYVTPAEPPMQWELAFTDGTKESLLEQLNDAVVGRDLPVHEGEMVDRIVKSANRFTVRSTAGTYQALRVIVAIGRTGNARQLDVPGERLAKVFTRLIDPGDFVGKDVLVVGGGDSAVEAAVALADAGASVTLSYRKPALSRPKESNLAAFDRAVAAGTIEPLFSSTVREIREADVVIDTADGAGAVANQAVFGLIGTEIPVRFFERSGIRMEGQRGFAYWVNLAAMASFFTMLYFGKSGVARKVLSAEGSLAENFWAYLHAPFTAVLPWGFEGHAWYASVNFILGWAGSLIFVASGLLTAVLMFRRRQHYFGTTWARIKYGYLTVGAVIFARVYFDGLLSRNALWVESPTYWYSLLYTTTIVLFGIRRMQVKPTGYIVRQTLALMLVQVLFLFLLPFHLYDTIVVGVFGPDSLVVREVFPQGKWSSFGLVLFWPLNMSNFGTSTFWTWFPLVQTFGVLWFVVHRWGKGAYCGWICSCGAMAETLGDEYRGMTPHGPKAKRLENIGQVILWWSVTATVLHVISRHATDGAVVADTIWALYRMTVDILFAGVLGLGVYFFLGGRVWCRYGCPLAALMHIYARLSPYRIMANKKRCISCNVCTRACHMGIDVMGYANRGIPMNDVECVRCSACVVKCPLQVLSFGDVGRADPHNRAHRDRYIPLKRGWVNGLHRNDSTMLLEREVREHGSLSTRAQGPRL